MILLCIESSATPTVVGIVQDKTVLAESPIDNRDHFPNSIRNLFEQTGLSPRDITAIALGIGPGSFTGLRVGAAFAKGFARAGSIPIWPVPSLQVFAANVEGQFDTICSISPARKAFSHWALYHGRTMESLTDERVVANLELSGYLGAECGLVGPGVLSLSPELLNRFKSHLPQDESAHRAQVSHLARLACERWCDKTAPELKDILPVYGLEFGA